MYFHDVSTKKENDVRKYRDTSYDFGSSNTDNNTPFGCILKHFLVEPSVFVIKFMQHRKMSVTACNVIRCGIRQRV